MRSVIVYSVKCQRRAVAAASGRQSSAWSLVSRSSICCKLTHFTQSSLRVGPADRERSVLHGRGTAEPVWHSARLRLRQRLRQVPLACGFRRRRLPAGAAAADRNEKEAEGGRVSSATAEPPAAGNGGAATILMRQTSPRWACSAPTVAAPAQGDPWRRESGG